MAELRGGDPAMNGIPDKHIANALAYARQLEYERQSIREGAELAAGQGEALRRTIVECTRAIVAAIREQRALFGPMEVATIAERRRAWLHTHAGEPLPAELREEARDAGGS